MKWKTTLSHGLLAALLASFACIIYSAIYSKSLGVDFTKLINPGAIIGTCLFGTLLMAIVYRYIAKKDKTKLTGTFNIVLVILSFLSAMGPLSMTLPLDIQNPELFPGLAAPMHFFPVLAFLTVRPFFKYE